MSRRKVSKAQVSSPAKQIEVDWRMQLPLNGSFWTDTDQDPRKLGEQVVTAICEYISEVREHSPHLLEVRRADTPESWRGLSPRHRFSLGELKMKKAADAPPGPDADSSGRAEQTVESDPASAAGGSGISRYANDAGWTHLEYRSDPLSGIAMVPLKPDGLPCQEHLLGYVAQDLAENLRLYPGRVAIRPINGDSGEPLEDGSSWEGLDPADDWQPAVREACPARVTLSPEQAAALPGVADVAPDEVPYAEPLWAIAVERSGRDWLEAAVRAGMVPHQEGIELAQQGLFLLVRTQVQDCIDQGVLGDAEGWLMFAEAYRKFAKLVLDEASALEQWRDALAQDGDS